MEHINNPRTGKPAQEITCTDDFIKYGVHVNDTVKYKGKYYTFDGLSPYESALHNPLNMLREIPIDCINAGDPYIGKRFDFRGYIVEIIQQNKNGSYSAQGYNKKGKKQGGRLAIMRPELAILKPLQ